MSINEQYKAMLLKTFGESITNSILESYKLDPVRGLRKNKCYSFEYPFETEPSIINPSIDLPHDYSKSVTHPFHHAGLYYIQDPTATVPVSVMDIKPDDIVLDMCGAPGGKTTHIINNLSKENGIVIVNEMDRGRAYKLKGNIERWGQTNVVITNEDGNNLPKYFPDTFDKVLLDAPCSGEGLFRRYKEHGHNYNPNTYKALVPIQQSLLKSAYHLVKDKGYILYSTCTLNQFENEGVVYQFLENYPECELVEIKWPTKYNGLGEQGHKMARFFPSKDGEGHFMAKIQVHKQVEDNNLLFKTSKSKTLDIDGITLTGYFNKVEDTLYYSPNRPFINSKCRIIMDGIEVGTYQKNYFEWSHAFSYYENMQNLFKKIPLSKEQAYEYLHGVALAGAQKKWHIVTYEGFNLGFVKGTGNTLNNKYPKHLRNKFPSY